MKSNQWVFLGVAAIVIVYAVKVYAGTVSLQTYYPAPTGFYDQMRVNKQLILPCYKDTSTTLTSGLIAGAIWIQVPTAGGGTPPVNCL